MSMGINWGNWKKKEMENENIRSIKGYLRKEREKMAKRRDNNITYDG